MRLLVDHAIDVGVLDVHVGEPSFRDKRIHQAEPLRLNFCCNQLCKPVILEGKIVEGDFRIKRKEDVACKVGKFQLPGAMD